MKNDQQRSFAKLTRAERWALECLLQTPLCLRSVNGSSALRAKLLRRRLVRLHGYTCSEHSERFVEITPKGRRALGRGVEMGLSVGSKPKWKVEDVVDIVAELRQEQTGDPSASFVSQLGIYKHAEGGRVVSEKSVQVIILNLPELGTPKATFRDQMVALGESLAEQLQQELVIVELQRAGKVVETIGVTGRVKRRRRQEHGRTKR